MFHDYEMLFGFLALAVILIAPIVGVMFILQSMTGGRASDKLLDITGNNSDKIFWIDGTSAGYIS